LIFTLTLNPCLDRYLYIDELIPEDTIRVYRIEDYAAGKGINVSRVIKEIGGNSIAICPLGGNNGNQIQFLLEKERVLYSAIRIEKETRMNIIIQTLKGQYRMSLPGAPLTSLEYDLIIDMIKAITRRGDTLIASGSLPEGLVSSVYFDIVKLCNDIGLRVYVDTDGDNLKEAVKAHPFGIKPNLFELSRLLGRDLKKEEVPSAAKEISEKYGINDVLVTLGKDGAIAYVDKETYKIDTIEVKVKSAVGAGDSFLAGFVYKRDESVEEALKWAVASSSASVMNEGTTLCKIKDVINLLDKATVKRI
jgi:6-phosphofructokinase 2